MISRFKVVVIIAVALLVSACESSSPLLDESRKEAIQVLLDDFVEFSHAPGVKVTVIDPEDQTWSSEAGVSNVVKGSPVDPSMRFRVGSHTKLVVGVIMMKLVERGLVNLDEPLTTYLPEYENWKDITVRMLLNMRSGIPDYLVISDITMAMLTDPDSSVTGREVVDKVYEQDRQFAPDTDGFYSDTNTFIAALIIERQTGRSLAANVRVEVADRYSMKNTYLDVTPFRKDDLIHGYLDLTVAGNDLTIVDPGLLSFLPVAGDMLPADMMITDTLVDSTYLANPSYAWAAGALVSTSEDLARFVRSLFEGQILSETSLEEMRNTRIIRMLGYPTWYGVSTQSFTDKLGTSYGHSGMSYGYRSATFHYPDSDWTVSMMCNTYPAPWMEFDTEIAEIINDPSVSPAAACTVTDNFDVNPDVPEIQAKFRGRFNTGDGEYVPTGFGTAVLVTGAARASLITRETMFGRNVYITTLEGGRVDIRFRGQAIDNSEAFWRDTHIIVPASRIEGVAAGESTTIDAGDDDIDMYIEDIWGTDDPDTYTKRCVTGVIDSKASSRMGFCDDVVVRDEGLVRGWMSVPVTRKIADVDAWVAQSGRAKCQCLADDGSWGDCE